MDTNNTRCHQTQPSKAANARKSAKLGKTVVGSVVRARKSDYVSINIHDCDNEKISRPPNAFMIFGKETRKLLAQKYPQFSNKQISKLLGEQWKGLPVERKTYYHGLAEDAAQMHRIKYPDYKYNANELRRQKEAKRAFKKSHGKNKPKNAKNSVNDRQTISDMLSNFTPDLAYSEVMKEVEEEFDDKSDIIDFFDRPIDNRITSSSNDNVGDKTLVSSLQFRVKKRLNDIKKKHRKSSRNKAVNIMPRNNGKDVICYNEEQTNSSENMYALDRNEMMDVEEIDVKPDINTLIDISIDANNMDQFSRTVENEFNRKSLLSRNIDENCVKAATLECGYCDAVFRQINELMSHISSEHNTFSVDNIIDDNTHHSTEKPTDDGVNREKIPRPPNSFMIFGKEKRKSLAQKYPQYSNKQISKLLGQQWKSLTVEMKMHYHCLAEDAVHEHRIKYPDYNYNPFEARRRKADRKLMSNPRRRKTLLNKTNKISNCANDAIKTTKSSTASKPSVSDNTLKSPFHKNTQSFANEKLVTRKSNRSKKQDMMSNNCDDDEQHINILPHAMIAHMMDKNISTDVEEDVKPDIHNCENRTEIFEKTFAKDMNLIEHELNNSLVNNKDDDAIEAMILECGNCDKVFHQLNEFMAHISNEHNTVSAANLDTITDLHQNSIDTEIEEEEEEAEKIPRPPNSFMIFGKERRKLLAQKYPQYSNKQISKVLGQQWKSLSDEEKMHYHCLAQEEVRMHRVKYPDYYYNPFEARRRKAELKMMKRFRRKKINVKKPKSSAAENNEQEISRTVLDKNENNSKQRSGYDLRANKSLSREKLNGIIHLRPPNVIDVLVTSTLDTTKNINSKTRITSQIMESEEIIVAEQTNEMDEKNGEICGDSVCVTHCEKYVSTTRNVRTPSHRTPQYKCVYCEKRFDSPQGVQEHHRLFHSCGDKQTFECNDCDERFTSDYALRKHRIDCVHYCQFKCNNCDYKSKLEKEVIAHQKTMHTEKLFVCNIPECNGKSFTYKRQLLTHSKNAHTLRLPFTCDWPDCSAVFTLKSALAVHIRSHQTVNGFIRPSLKTRKSNESVYKTCTKSVLDSRKMPEHLSEIPFNCEWPHCGASFKTFRSLRFHMKIHEPD